LQSETRPERAVGSGTRWRGGAAPPSANQGHRDGRRAHRRSDHGDGLDARLPSHWHCGVVDFITPCPFGAGTPAASPAWISRVSWVGASSHSIRRSFTRPSIARITALWYAGNEG